MQKKTVNIPIPVLIVVLAAVIGIVSGAIYMSRRQQAETHGTVTAMEVVPWDVEIPEELASSEPESTILLPGYGSMTMKADTKEQDANIGNPSENNCYFVIDLTLDDGTLLFESDYLKPGEGYNYIVLEQTLPAGEYTARLDYHCYTLEDKSTLNGGGCEFQLIVK